MEGKEGREEGKGKGEGREEGGERGGQLTQCIHFQLPGEVVYWSFDLVQQLLLSRVRDLLASHCPFDWLDGVVCFPDNL